MIKQTAEFTGEKVTIFTDGSYANGQELYAFVILLGDTEVARGYGSCSLLQGARNVSGELEAAYRACKFAYDNGASRIHLYADYEGVKFFALGMWTARTPVAIEYQKLIWTIPIPIDFEIIRGHSGNKYNELVDKLAKSAKI